jgi:hypothetical protein
MEEDDDERSSAARKKRKELEVVAASGMAWGAKSFSAAKISSIREKDPGSVSDFGRFKSFVSSLCILLANGVREFFNVDSDNLCFYTIQLVLCVCCWA